ncbi:MAG: alpha/beta hydrolase [Candidatus Lokiarchaeota archaeon]|nr:alpha/beta hydrolase [Candidatus Lokiarchaeota archaeon]
MPFQERNISKTTVDFQKTRIIFDDGMKSSANFYRSISETILTDKGRRYPEPRPTIIFFHGFWAKKEENEKYLISLAHMGFVAVAFDQRGHGEAEGKKSDWFKLYNDVDSVLDFICTFDDVKKGALCCIGKSMGATSVLTKCYVDKRVAMVIGISALHSIEHLIKAKFPFLSSGWFVKRLISKVKDEKALKTTARYFLKNDPNFNENRVYLIHGREDKIFPFSITFEFNKKQAKIPEKHALLLDRTGHNLGDQELLVFGIIIKWILENEAMKFFR